MNDEKEKETKEENIQKQNKFQSEYKINRIHRINLVNSQSDKVKLKFSSQTKNKNELKFVQSHSFSNYKNSKNKEYENEIYNEEITKEIDKRKNIYNKFKSLFSKMKKDKMMGEETSELNDTIYEEGKNLVYYIINLTWFNQFKNYCSKDDLTSSNINEDYPGQINNQHLILKDENCLKLPYDNRIIINSKFSDNCTAITPELWQFLVNICGGGPEIKYIRTKDYKNNEIEVIKKGVRINLLYIPKKEIISNKTNKEPSNNIINPLNPFQSEDVTKILVNNENRKIKTEYIYFDIKRTVQDLMNYINKILNIHRNKFTNLPLYFGANCNSERSTNTLVENINYRLWLDNLIMKPEELAEQIMEYILRYEDPDFPMNFNQTNFSNEEISSILLLSNFAKYKISDIFPNKYTKNFNSDDYENHCFEDENNMPVMTILIEEYPYHFKEPKKKYLIKKCDYCKYRDYVFSGCICNKVFYCSDFCKKNDLNDHIIYCRDGIFSLISQKNKDLSKVVIGRKKYYEKNLNEKISFPILGLSNLGNSCYMNSALQCLFSIKELNNYLLYNFKEEFINKENILGTKGLLTIGYINLLLNINNTTNNKYYEPKIFKIILGLCSNRYKGNQQEDAHEFLNYLLDKIHEDLNKVINKGNNNLDEEFKYDNKSIEEMGYINWNKFLKKNQSILIDIFYGQYESNIICPKCKFCSINFNSFLSLELPISEYKNYILVPVIFYDILSESPAIHFTIILYKNEKKIYFLRKKIANLLELDMLEFEIASIKNSEIIHIYEMSEEIISDKTIFYAFRVDPKYFYSENNERFREILKKNEGENLNYESSDRYKIDFDNLKYNIKKRKTEIIEYNRNKNINDDYLYFTLKYNNNLGLNNTNLQKVIVENFLMENGNTENIESDKIIYIEKNKKCNEIYLEFFRKFSLNIIFGSENQEIINKFCKLHSLKAQEKLEEEIDNLFNHFFKKIYIDPSELDLINNFPDCPFLLFLKNSYYDIKEFIPFNTEENYNNILNDLMEKQKMDNFKNENSNLLETKENISKNKDKKNTYEDIINNILLNAEQKSNEEKNNGLPGGIKENEEEDDENNSENNEFDLVETDSVSVTEENSYEEIKKTNGNNLYFPNQTENDKKIDKIIVMFNPKYIKNINRFKDINLINLCNKLYEISSEQKISIENCFSDFSKEEKLDKNNLWKCPNCNENIQAIKKIQLYNAPKILIIHLKRFNNNKKINTFIDFPLKKLDLSEYSINPEIKNYKYDLFGVINHYGSLNSGHYTAFCKNYHNGNWYEYNDRIVNLIQKEKEQKIIVNRNAYVLFYREHNNDYIKWDKIYNKNYENISINVLKKFGEDFEYENFIESDIENEKELDIKIDNKIFEEIKNAEEFDRLTQNKSEDNFSFKEGENNLISDNNQKKIEDYFEKEEKQTPKFRNNFNKTLEEKNKNIQEKKQLDFNEDQTTNINNNNLIPKVNDNKYQTQKKNSPLKKNLSNYLTKIDKNVIRIKTYRKPNKMINAPKVNQFNHNKDEPDKNENKKFDNNEMDNLLKYDIFNESKNYFKLNSNIKRKPLQSVRSKELTNFLLKEINDSKSDKVPRSKVLYNKIILRTEKKKIISIIPNIENKNNGIQEENDGIKDANNNNEVNIEDFVYNPFRECFEKLKKF